MGTMIKPQNWHTEWLRRTIERMDELDKRGEKEVTLYVLEFQRILMELLAMHQRADRLEEVLCSYARYYVLPSQSIEPPLMFGGSSTGNPKCDEHCHIFLSSGYGYDVCNDCGMSDVYYNWAYNKKS